jgi:hypothetical protein
MDIGGVQVVSNDVVRYLIFRFWGFIYLIVVCLMTPLTTQTIYRRMTGRSVVWKACRRASFVGTIRLLDSMAEKPRS